MRQLATDRPTKDDSLETGVSRIEIVDRITLGSAITHINKSLLQSMQLFTSHGFHQVYKAHEKVNVVLIEKGTHWCTQSSKDTPFNNQLSMPINFQGRRDITHCGFSPLQFL